MLRNTIIAATSALALSAAGGAVAQSGSPERSTSPGTEVASQKQLYYETNSPAVGTDPAPDSQSINMPMDTFKALANARGNPMITNDGMTVGTILEVDYNAQGNPELVVDLQEDVAIEADRLIVTVLPGNMSMTGDRIALDTSLRELELKAEKGNFRDSEDRIDVTIF